MSSPNSTKSQTKSEPSFAALDGARPLYFLPADDLAEEVLIPGFHSCESAECMAGFFSSEALADLAPGLASYIAQSPHPFRLIVSPFISEKDRVAIEAGVLSNDDAAVSAFSQLLITEELLKQHTLRCLSYLIRVGRLEIKIAVMRDSLFHPKVWIFKRGNQIVAAHGSSNMTHPGIRKNFEQISVSKSWSDPNQRYVTEKLTFQFDRLWNNREDHCAVIPAPQAIKDQILKSFPTTEAPTEKDFRALYKKATNQEARPAPIVSVDNIQQPDFRIPDWLKYEEGPFAHQGKAVKAWCAAGYRGILEIATGSGKTLTSMICAHRLYSAKKPLLIVVGAPYVPLIEQWCGEIAVFGLRPVNLTLENGPDERTKTIQRIKRRLRSRLSSVEVLVVSHDTLCTKEFVSAIADFNSARLLIADEVHNLGRLSFISDPPECFEYRLGLSATPVRQYDDEGTAAMMKFFGPIAFAFKLKDAIGRCLVEYDYFLHSVTLTQREMDQWYDLTAKIKANAWREEDGKPDAHLSMLLRERRAILEMAEGKVGALAACLQKENLRTLKHTLIYCTDKGPSQLEAVNRLLSGQGILFHQLTAEETADRELTKRIIQSFQEGEVQVLTAKRVLDEGVNIPQICKAFILASTTVERQWIQRRGRLLRTCKEISKTFSTIHDFLSLPKMGDAPLDDDARNLIRSELARAQEFASLAKNAGRPDGPLSTIDGLVRAAFW